MILNLKMKKEKRKKKRALCMHKAHATRLVNNNKLHQTSCKNSIGNYQIWSMYPVDVEPALSGIGA